MEIRKKATQKVYLFTTEKVIILKQNAITRILFPK